MALPNLPYVLLFYANEVAIKYGFWKTSKIMKIISCSRQLNLICIGRQEKNAYLTSGKACTLLVVFPSEIAVTKQRILQCAKIPVSGYQQK